MELVLSMFGSSFGLFGFGGLGMLTAIAGLVLGVFMLILDFDFVEQGIAQPASPSRSRGAPRSRSPSRWSGSTPTCCASSRSSARRLTAADADVRPVRRTRASGSVRACHGSSPGWPGVGSRRSRAPRRLGRSGWRRRCRSSTHRPRTPRRRPPTSVPSSSVPGVLTAWTAASAIGSTPSPRRPRAASSLLGRGRARPAPTAAARRPASGSRRRTGGTGRARTAAPARRRTPGRGSSRGTRCGRRSRRTAMVCAAASRRDQVRATCLSGGAIGLRVPRSGQVPTSTAIAGVAQPADRLGEVAHRRRRPHLVGDVVGADQDHRDVRLDRQRPVDLGGRGREDSAPTTANSRR